MKHRFRSLFFINIFPRSASPHTERRWHVDPLFDKRIDTVHIRDNDDKSEVTTAVATTPAGETETEEDTTRTATATGSRSWRMAVATTATAIETATEAMEEVDTIETAAAPLSEIN